MQNDTKNLSERLLDFGAHNKGRTNFALCNLQFSLWFRRIHIRSVNQQNLKG